MYEKGKLWNLKQKVSSQQSDYRGCQEKSGEEEAKVRAAPDLCEHHLWEQQRHTSKEAPSVATTEPLSWVQNSAF